MPPPSSELRPIVSLRVGSARLVPGGYAVQEFAKRTWVVPGGCAVKNMLLENEQLKTYRQEIADLYQEELGDSILGLILFGIISGETLQAVASVKNYMGTWYLRGCVVKPEFRGMGLQRKLIQERLDYLALRTKQVRVSVFPDNQFSIRNIETEGFKFEKRKKIENGEYVLVYKKELKEPISFKS